MKKALKYFLNILFYFIAASLAAFLLYLSLPQKSVVADEDARPYPRLANYFLDWDVTPSEIPELAKWDVLVLTPQAEERSPGLLKKLKTLNPKITILVYQLTQETSPAFADELVGTHAKNIFDVVEKNNWWLRDTSGNTASLWPTNRIINITPQYTGWTDFITKYISDNYFKKHQELDGIFFDNVWYDINWLPNIKVDLNRDSLVDGESSDELWRKATKEILDKTRQMSPGKIIFGNVNFDFFNGSVNGKLFESFGRNQNYSWAQFMKEYLGNTYGYKPSLVIINENAGNKDSSTNYKQMRFALGSSMLGNGYFSYDIGDCCHNSLWRYDEYEADLGQAISEPKKLYQIFNRSLWREAEIAPGIWRRDFENGIVLVNSTPQSQTVKLEKNYQKINGVQDPLHNDGTITDTVVLEGKDSIILLNN